jgi:CBS domain-containing protein
MTPEPITIDPDMPVKEIAALMDRKKVYTLPVVDRGKLVGIVGKLDLIRALARQPAE